MIRVRHWHGMPSLDVREALPKLMWAKPEDGSAAAATAALMLWIALRFTADKTVDDDRQSGWASTASYDELHEATGLSRTLIAQGLQRLESLGAIARSGSSQRRQYALVSSAMGWFKLPCQALIVGGRIKPFLSFTMRSKHELHALKLYLFLASVRANRLPYSMANYDTINSRTGIQERDIPRAINVLNASGLIARVVREAGDDGSRYGPNQYFLTGYQELFSDAGSARETANEPRLPYIDDL